MSVEVTYLDQDRPIQSVTAKSESSGWTIRARKDQGMVYICTTASETIQMGLCQKDAAEFGAALIKLAKQS